PRTINSLPKVTAQHRFEFRMPYNLKAKRASHTFDGHIIVRWADATRCKHVVKLSGAFADRSGNDIRIVGNNHDSSESDSKLVHLTYQKAGVLVRGFSGQNLVA